MVDVQIHYRADPWLARPGEKAFGVAFDQADGAVDQLRLVLPEVRTNSVQERGQRGARHVKLADHFGALVLGAELPVERLMIIVDIDAELAGVGPVALSRRRKIVGRISFIGAARVRM